MAKTLKRSWANRTEEESVGKLVFKRRAQKWFRIILRLAFMIGMSFVMLYPVLFVLSVAFKDVVDVYDPTVIWIPKNYSLKAMQLALEAMSFGKSLLQTLRLTVPCVLLELISCTLTAYGFSRFKFRERNVLFAVLLFTIVVPVQTYIIPQYVGFTQFNFLGLAYLPAKLGLITLPSYANTMIPMYVMAAFGMGIRSGLYIFILRQFLKGLPVELEEAALIDGCGPVRTLWKVMIPNLVPALVTIAVFSVVWYWNDYYVSAFYLSRDFPLSVNLTLLNGQLSSTAAAADMTSQEIWLMSDSVLACGCLLVMTPLMVMYIFAQKQFTEGIERTGIVG